MRTSAKLMFVVHRKFVITFLVRINVFVKLLATLWTPG